MLDIFKKINIGLACCALLLGLVWGGIYIYYNHSDIMHSPVVNKLGGGEQ